MDLLSIEPNRGVNLKACVCFRCIEHKPAASSFGVDVFYFSILFGFTWHCGAIVSRNKTSLLIFDGNEGAIGQPWNSVGLNDEYAVRPILSGT